jgi:hypothetical protein
MLTRMLLQHLVEWFRRSRFPQPDFQSFLYQTGRSRPVKGLDHTEVRMCYLRDGVLHDQPFAKLPDFFGPLCTKSGRV